MIADLRVRRARLADAQAIADFVNAANPNDNPVLRQDVAKRFGQVGFIIAQHEAETVGLLGWQVENLVVRVTDFIISSSVDRAVTSRELIAMMEEQGGVLQAEAVLLILPRQPSPELVAFWQAFGYEFQQIGELEGPWREAAAEWGMQDHGVMVKRLRNDMIQRPM